MQSIPQPPHNPSSFSSIPSRPGREKPIEPTASTTHPTSTSISSLALLSPSAVVLVLRRFNPPKKSPKTAETTGPSIAKRTSESSVTSSETPQPSEAIPATSTLETPLTSLAPSETDSTQPTTPSSAVAPAIPRQQHATGPKPTHKAGPSVPIIPAIPNIPLPQRPIKRTSVSITSETVGPTPPPNADHLNNAAEIAIHIDQNNVLNQSEPQSTIATSPAKAVTKSWADLVRANAPGPAAGPIAPESRQPGANGLHHPKAASTVEVLRNYGNGSDNKRVAFIEPRGLLNTGNMCYMNAVLQILIFCVPFYDLLEQLGRRATHSFKSETPLVDAMIMFMHEYRVIDAAESVEKLRMRLRKGELEQYGEAFVPEFVYEVIRRLPRFASMRRGHQQDAEEFLGFLLEEMHDECTKAMRSSPFLSESTPANGVVSPTSESTNSTSATDSGWLEVGPKQKAAITRSSGIIITESPITKIFGGKIRSELRVPGMKHSVTLEPYQPLQLDIGAPQVNNIIDALKGLTRSETLHGNFNSPRGPGVAATKQVTIETLPQVLILHLKRFQYDNTGGTLKIWKKIGYPLDLEIPKEVFPQHRRGGILAHGGLPKYRLIGVVYHHGKNASSGHYTVDVRRQDGREWIRLDDTIIRRVRSEDVAEGGSEEDPKVLAAALQQHKDDVQSSQNLYDQFAVESEEQAQAEKGWNQVNGTSPGATSASKKWSGVVNGASTPQSSSGHRTPVGRFPIRDNKVAYILFYERLKP
ncbi:MAG: hypothetical protein L6R39_006236 [Caloplaca ligustica]|nr:MAG: hypothetical protein L6R39_006236 [Caloplaca ligustica]